MALDKYMIKHPQNMSRRALKEAFNLNSSIAIMVKEEVSLL